jgi:hypothetical protein
MTELITAAPASWAMGVSAETRAITAVVPPVKKTSWTSSPFFSKIPRVLGNPGGECVAADGAVGDV